MSERELVQFLERAIDAHRARTELRRILEGRLEEVAREVLAFHLSRCDRIVRAVLARCAEVARDGVREG